MPGQKSFMGNKCPGIYTDKYGMYIYSKIILGKHGMYLAQFKLYTHMDAHALCG